jgi:DNA invertase Pin-like site-specific DNA recombinase
MVELSCKSCSTSPVRGHARRHSHRPPGAFGEGSSGSGARIEGEGVKLKATEQPIDTGTAAGKAFLDMLGVFAEFETNLRKERQLEGIAAAKARGVYKGRKPTIDPGAVRKLAAEGVGATEIARRLGIGRASVYRLGAAA